MFVKLEHFEDNESVRSFTLKILEKLKKRYNLDLFENDYVNFVHSDFELSFSGS